MCEEPTRQQIRKLYAVVRNAGLDPKEYVKKVMEEKGVASLNMIPKTEMSKMIDEFETLTSAPNSTPAQNEKKEVVETFGTFEEFETFEEEKAEEKKKTEVVETSEVSKEDRDHLNEIDALFSECIARASNLVHRKFARTEQIPATTILEIARMYFEEVRKGAERG